MLYEIWTEGFRVSGETGGKAYKVGEQRANSFEEACDLFVKHNPQYQDCYKKVNGIPSYWACRWFDNEADARKSLDNMRKRVLINTDSDGAAVCIKSNYYKMGSRNFQPQIGGGQARSHRSYGDSL